MRGPVDTVVPDGIQTMDLPDNSSVAFDIDAFDSAIRSHGVRFVHWRSMLNPVGLKGKYDSRRPGDDHSGASNGFIYTKAGTLSAFMVGNTKAIQAITQGLLDSSIAQITPSRFYDSGEEVLLAPGDRLYLEECSIVVTVSELVESSATGTDILRFPAVRVLDLVDSQKERYSCGADFKILDGAVVWTSQNRPGIDPDTGNGRVYAIRYVYRPYWIVERMMHEIRVAQYEDIMGNRKVARMPQLASIQRENVYRNEKNDPEAAPSDRQGATPPDGSFGAK